MRPDYALRPLELYTYVHIEGVRELNRVPMVHQNINMVWAFHYACISAFGLPASHPAVVGISNRALWACNAPLRIHFVVLVHAMWCRSYANKEYNPLESKYSPKFTTFLAIARALWALLFAFIACARVCVYLQYLRLFDHNMTTPDGVVRSYAEWMVWVDNTAELVKQGLPPR